MVLQANTISSSVIISGGAILIESVQCKNQSVIKKTTFYCVVYYNGDAVDTAFITVNVLPNAK